MTQLSERHALRCPFARAWEYLNRALCQIAEYQEPDSVRLRLPLAGAAGPVLQKEVTVTYHRDAGETNDRPWSVCWQAVGGIPYPDFNGTLTIDIGKDNTAPILVLKGEYTPPLGVAGQAFDSVLGSRVASITAREFLRSIAAQMEKHYIADEAREGRTVS
ncbi:MAG: hypothetical protein ACXWNK_17165 [Vulcanimicrobiaceae bacterium]